MKKIGMTMAKATEGDMDAMLTINGILNDIEGGEYPRGILNEFEDGDPTFFDEDDGDHCRVVVQRLLKLMRKSPGCTNRVVWGFHTVLFNDVFDAAETTLQWHPDLRAAVEARNAKALPAITEVGS